PFPNSRVPPSRVEKSAAGRNTRPLPQAGSPRSARAWGLDRQPIELTAQSLELVGRSGGEGPGGARIRRRGPRPAAQYQRQYPRRHDEHEGRHEVADEVEPTLRWCHQDRDAVLADKRVQDLRPGLSRLRQRHHAAMHGRTCGTSKVGRAAGVDILVAAARAVYLLLDRLDDGVVVGGGDGLERPPRARRVPETAGRSRSREGIGRLRRCTTPRRYDAKKSPPTQHQELAPINVQRSVVASGDAHFPSPTSRTAYPACDRLAAGEPPG